MNKKLSKTGQEIRRRLGDVVTEESLCDAIEYIVGKLFEMKFSKANLVDLVKKSDWARVQLMCFTEESIFKALKQAKKKGSIDTLNFARDRVNQMINR